MTSRRRTGTLSIIIRNLTEDCEMALFFIFIVGRKQVCYERQRISFLLVWQRGWRRNETRRDSVRGVMQPLAAAA
jgi:hypothetical protein